MLTEGLLGWNSNVNKSRWKNRSVILAYPGGKDMILSKGKACMCVGICDLVTPYIF